MAAREPLPVLAACGLAFEAALAAGPGVVAVCGPGPGRLTARLDALLDARPDPLHAERMNEGLHARVAVPSAAEVVAHVGGATEHRPTRAEPAWAGILSFGCAGALDPELAPGTCILATGIQTAGGFLCADAAWLRSLARCLPRAVHGELAGLDAPLTSARDKAVLWRASGACAVDMESHAAARIARRHGLPFAACRVVLDPAWRGVPPSALAGMAADGGTRPAPLLRALAAAPGELGPLCLLAWDALRARRALGQVRARLGARLAAP
ncbi:squalene--hopene cyclase [Herbaspirillum sp. SJZ107]|uniref:phosphorylase family protein n=1 Tax=Herbaspirillum sp. SJZ107 TaxID=2572881 RepID=UPI0011515AAD|nr:squalene--hopene cyclase [Herbaspirillum sp. SJZ107]TQK11966.1 hopanoid-associated phosphorylase [Herbaspirillum sp. SJZ107]